MTTTFLYKRYIRHHNGRGPSFFHHLEGGLPINVLVVDNHETNRIVLVHVLQKLGCTPDTAANGLEAVEATKVKTYQLIFMDIQMPLMDGMTAAKAILLSNSSPPRIVAVTGDIRKHCLALGMADFIVKPIRVQRIIQAIGSLSNKSRPVQ